MRDMASLKESVRAVALLETAKGVLAVVIGCGVLTLMHRDTQRIAEELVEHLHLNPASKYPHIFIAAASRATSGKLWLLAAGAALYSAVRFVEGYGLWNNRRWAEWLGALGAGIYVPFEIYQLFHKVTIISVGSLIVNLAVVGLLALALWNKQNEAPE